MGAARRWPLAHTHVLLKRTGPFGRSRRKRSGLCPASVVHDPDRHGRTRSSRTARTLRIFKRRLPVRDTTGGRPAIIPLCCGPLECEPGFATVTPRPRVARRSAISGCGADVGPGAGGALGVVAIIPLGPCDHRQPVARSPAPTLPCSGPRLAAGAPLRSGSGDRAPVRARQGARDPEDRPRPRLQAVRRSLPRRRRGSASIDQLEAAVDDR